MTPPALAHVEVGDVSIAYEAFGDRADPPVLLVMGLGTQMLAWPDELCAALAARGHWVVRFDNRDVGASTHLTGQRAPALRDLALRRGRPPYTIEDMAGDVLGLMDGLGLASAHLVGASMGGFIAQTVALRAPSRVRSLGLIMTSTGSRRVGQARPATIAAVLKRRRRAARDRETAVADVLATFGIIGSRGYAADEDYLSDLAGRSWDRGHDPGGYYRQLAAISVQPDRTRALRDLTCPTVVLHGLHDPLVAFSGAVALARAIPGARLVGYAGMGHDLPRPLWPDFVRELGDVAARA